MPSTLTQLGTLPENTRADQVLPFFVSAEHGTPGLIVHQRGDWAELVWDRDAGWQYPWHYGSSLEQTEEGVTFRISPGHNVTNDTALFYAIETLAIGPQGPQGDQGDPGPTGPQPPLSSATPTMVGATAAAGSGTSASKDDHVHALPKGVRSYTLADLVAGGSGAGIAGDFVGEVIALVGGNVVGDGLVSAYRWNTSAESKSPDFVKCIQAPGGYWHQIRADKTASISGAGTSTVAEGTTLVTATSGTPIVSATWQSLMPGHVLVCVVGASATSITLGSDVIRGAGNYGVFVAVNGAWVRIDRPKDAYSANLFASGSITLAYGGPRATYALTLTGNVTITFPGSSDGAQYGDQIDLLLMQNGTGGFTSAFTSGADTGAYVLSNDTGNTAAAKKFIRFVRAYDRWCATPRQTYTWA